MYDGIEIVSDASAKAKVTTLKDLRQFVAWLNKYGVPDDAELDWGSEYVWVSLTEGAKAIWIQCGHHLVGQERYDVLIETHTHEDAK